MIEVNNLGYQVSDQCLLDGLSFQLQPGKIHALLGQNGAGKSTLLACLTAELTPSSGQVIWQGESLSDLSLRELALQRAVLAQSLDLSFSYRVEELVLLGAEVQPVAVMVQQQIVDQVLALCELETLRSRDYLTLSGGEQKRAQLARVLAQIWPINQSHPDLSHDAFAGKWLFLDEWTAGLDIKHQQQLSRYLQMWAQAGLGIVMVMHDLSLTAQLADECLILQQGALKAQGPVREVMTQATLEQTMEMKVDVMWDENGQRLNILPVLESFSLI